VDRGGNLITPLASLIPREEVGYGLATEEMRRDRHQTAVITDG
jgi:hypothetical protein